MVGAPPAATPTAAAVPAPAPGVAANGGGPAAAATAPAAGPPQSEATAQAIPIDSVKVWPSLFSMGIGYEAHLFGGTVSGSVGLWGKSHVVIHSKGLDLARANAKASVGVDLAGKLDTNIDLVLDPDGTKTTGKVSITGEGLIINGGTVAQYDLPKVELGQLDMALKLDGGKGTVDLFKTQGGDVDAALEGEIALAQKILLSALKLKLKFKPGEDFLKRNSFIQTGLSFAMSKDGRGFYTVNVNRVLGNPGFQPQR
jgi:type II secretion system protein N